jgi:hypothetical protein
VKHQMDPKIEVGCQEKLIVLTFTFLARQL